MGFSRWRTPIEVWLEKTGQLPPNMEENIPAEVGNELEDYVARKYCQRTGEKVIRVSEAYQHKKYPFLRAHIDRKIVGKKKLLQCKTCSAYKAKEWEDEEIPLDYILQEYKELACTGYDEADIAVLIGNYDLKIKTIRRDDKAIGEMVDKLAHFWNTFVIPKAMPVIFKPKDMEVLSRLYPKAEEGKEVVLTDEANAIIENLEALKKDKGVAEGEIKKLNARLASFIKENEIGTTGLYRVKWGNVHKNEYTVKAQDYRQLRISKEK